MIATRVISRALRDAERARLIDELTRMPAGQTAAIVRRIRELESRPIEPDPNTERTDT